MNIHKHKLKLVFVGTWSYRFQCTTCKELIAIDKHVLRDRILAGLR